MYHLFSMHDAKSHDVATTARESVELKRAACRAPWPNTALACLGFGLLVGARVMKRLLVLTAVALSIGAQGCKHCGVCGGGAPTAVYRPPCPAPACAPTCGAPSGGYVVSGPTTTT